MRDPYDVLGISHNAEEEEIKKAYRKLSREYHPDNNMNNPHKDEAEKKFKEVQSAYEQIMREKENPGYGSGPAYQNGSSGSGSGGYGNFDYGDFWDYFGGGQNNYRRSGQNKGQEESYYNAAWNYISNRHYEEAMNVLHNISEKNSTWYYYHALASQGLGNNIDALNDAKKAVEMEPTNMAYQDLVTRLEGGKGWYEQQTKPFRTFGGGMNTCCWTFCMLQMCCGSCGGSYGAGYPGGVHFCCI